jgi:acetyltransferase-like isoleucine patch superfamily enzyme
LTWDQLQLRESGKRGIMITADVHLGENVVVYHPDLVNLYGCEIGDGCKIGAFVEIRKQVKIGRNVKIQAFAFIPEGVTIEDGVFIGPHVCFTNDDKYPRAVNPDGSLMEVDDWQIVPTLVKQGASVGANAAIMCGITIGEYAMVGAGAVVTHDVPAHAIVAGVPARVVGDVRDRKEHRPK